MDCQALATAQCIYANQLKAVGVVDEIIWEKASVDPTDRESYKSFPVLRSRISSFIASSLRMLLPMTAEQLIAHRYAKFRAMGTFRLMNAAERAAAVAEAEVKKGATKRPPKVDRSASLLIQHLAQETVCGASSRYRKLAPASCPANPPAAPVIAAVVKPEGWVNAKKVLDASGPEAVASWVKAQTKVLITDTTMRDAHQSLIATRARTEDLVKGAKIANELLKDAFRCTTLFVKI